MYQLAKFSSLSPRNFSAPKPNFSHIATQNRVILGQAPILARRWSTQATKSTSDGANTHFATDKDMYLNTLKITDDCAKVKLSTIGIYNFI